MKNQREGLIVTHVYEVIKILLLSIICWSFIDSRQTSLKVLETIDQIKAISTNQLWDHDERRHWSRFVHQQKTTGTVIKIVYNFKPFL